MPGTLTSRTGAVQLTDPPDPSPSRPLAVGKREAARLLGISEYTVARMIRRGQLQATRIFRRVVVPMSALEELVERGTPPKREGGSVS